MSLGLQLSCGFYFICVVHLFLQTQAYKPSILEDFDDVVGAVVYGSRVRYDVTDLNLCDSSIPASMQLTPFMTEVQSADVNRGSDSFGDGVIVTSYEQEMLGTGYGNKSLVLRQIQTWIRFDGSASIHVVDYQPLTFKIYADATLNCLWQNDTDNNVKAAGMRIWAQQWQATEMGTMDRLVEGVSKGHVIFFYIDAGLTQPPQYRSYWAGPVHDITTDNGTITFYSQSVSGTYLIGMEIATQANGNVSIIRNVLDRRSRSFVNRYTLIGTFGYHTAVHFYWKNLFTSNKGHHSVNFNG